MSKRDELRQIVDRLEELDEEYRAMYLGWTSLKQQHPEFDFGREDPSELELFSREVLDFHLEILDDLRELYLDEFPRRRKVTLKRVFEEIPDQARQTVQQNHQIKIDHRSALMDRLDDRADRLAMEIEPEQSEDEESIIDTARLDSFRSQGFGQTKYTKGSLRETEIKLDHLGIDSEIRDVQDRDDVFGDYAVIAPVSQVDAEVIDRRPDPTREEVIENLRDDPQLNVRVYYPSLPSKDENGDWVV